MALSFTRCTGVTVEHNEVDNPKYGSQPGRTDRQRPRPPAVHDVVIAGNRVVGVKSNTSRRTTSRTSPSSVTSPSMAATAHRRSQAQRGTIVGNVCQDLTEFAPDPGGEAGIEIEYRRPTSGTR